MEIHRVAVIGSGVMGSGIAAHLANAGIPVLLLDIVPLGATDRSQLARGAIERMLKTEPAPLMHPRHAERITSGNIDDDIGALAGCDWIIEAVLEDLATKRALYTRLDNARKKGSIVSSNTSTIPLALLIAEQSAQFAKDFCVTHFFNPPRYMRLLELVAGPQTRADAIAALRHLCDVRLGKGVVDCKDTPGFIANRIGTFWMQVAVNEAIALGLTVEEADAVMGKPIGVPTTGVFGLFDLVGIDLMPHVSKSLLSTLPVHDAYRDTHVDHPLIAKMIADGHTGRKGKGGFYRMIRTDTGKVFEAIDVKTGVYRATKPARLASIQASGSLPASGFRLQALVSHPDRGGRYAWNVLKQVLNYAAARVPEIADSIVAVDEAMRLGFGWQLGPFELIDQLGAKWFAGKLANEGITVAPLLAKAAASGSFYIVETGVLKYLGTEGRYNAVPRADGVLLLADVKRRTKPVHKNGSAALWDIGDGVLCLEFTTRMNAIDPFTLLMIEQAIVTIGDGRGAFCALVVYNEGAQFSVGANLARVLLAVNIAAWKDLERAFRGGQEAFKALKYAPFPVVGAVHSMALGGGCELLLHCDAVQAHVECNIGLVETGVGVVPAWGGCKEMLVRALGAHPGNMVKAIGGLFDMIMNARVSRSADDAREMLFLGEDDGVTMNRDRLLADGKATALLLGHGYEPPKPAELRLPGVMGRDMMVAQVKAMRDAGKATDHDVAVASELAGVLSGGDANPSRLLHDDDLFALERAAFLRLLRLPATVARIEHMLATGKPLRN